MITIFQIIFITFHYKTSKLFMILYLSQYAALGDILGRIDFECGIFWNLKLNVAYLVNSDRSYFSQEIYDFRLSPKQL